MATLQRVVISWTGFPGGPGASVLYFRAASTARTPLSTWISAWKYLVPDNVTITIPNSGDEVDTATAQITGTWTAGSVITLVGTGSSTSYFAAGGASVRWNTNTIRNGRKVKGRTFLVPMTALAYDNGTLVGTAVTILNSSTTTYLADAGVAQEILSRPSTPGGTDGTSGLVTSFQVKDKQAILSSRRD